MGKISTKTLSDLVKKYCVIAKVCIQTNRPVYAFKRNDRLVFPTGEFIAILTTPEIKEALAKDRIDRILEVAVYEKAPIFSQYVKYFWGKRKIAQGKSDEAASYMHKLMMNAL